MSRVFFVLGSTFGFLAVALGAFAAHGLETRLDANALARWETAARYQMYHALALLAAAWAATQFPAAQRLVAWAGWMFVGGIVLFSGSLYILALSGVRLWGAVTPFGGTAFLLGWLLLALAAWRGR